MGRELLSGLKGSRFADEVHMKSRPRLSILRCLSLLIAISLAAPGAYAQAAEKQKKSSEIVVAVQKAYPHYEYVEDGEVRGFNVEILQAIAERLGMQIEWRPMLWSEAYNALEAGDVALLCMPISEKREERFDFTAESISNSSLAMFVPNSFSGPVKLEDLAGLTVAIKDASIAQEILAQKIQKAIAVPVDDDLRALRYVEKGWAAAYLGDLYTGLYLVRRHGLDKIKVVGGPLSLGSVRIAVKKGNDQLLSKLNEELTSLKKSPEYERIRDKWFGEASVVRSAWKKVLVIAVAICAFLGMATLVVLLWNYTLRRLVDERTRDLVASEDRYRILITHANEGIFVLQDEFIRYHNPQTETLIGCSSEELTSSPFTGLVHPEDRVSVATWLTERLLEGDSGSGYPFRIINKSGNVLWWEVNAVHFAWEGKPAVLCFVRDVTSHKKMETQLRQAQKMEAIGTLASGIAHDFNNILMAIMGNAEMAEMGLNNNPENRLIRQSLDQVLKASNRAKDLVKQILTFSRDSEQDRKPVQINLLIEEVLKLLKVSLPENIEIRQDISVDSDTVMADAVQIHQVMMNLCTNAHHAMVKRGGVLAVALKRADLDTGDTMAYPDLKPGPYLKLSVKDTGDGIKREVMGRIFDPYFTTKEKGLGTGLGLSVVHRIIQSHGGWITVESEPGEGTVFEILLPRVEGRSEREAPTRRGQLSAGQERILFVDDEEGLVSMAERYLATLGYEVSAFTSPSRALEAFRADPDGFDLLITDLTMPQMSGDELAERIREERPDIPIILCTGYSERLTKEGVKELGIQSFVMKPFKIRDLAEEIHTIVRSTERVRRPWRVKLHPVRKSDSERASQWKSEDLKTPQRRKLG
jgi:PAS domain S-box-containing protein